MVTKKLLLIWAIISPISFACIFYAVFIRNHGIKISDAKVMIVSGMLVMSFLMSMCISFIALGEGHFFKTQDELDNEIREMRSMREKYHQSFEEVIRLKK